MTDSATAQTATAVQDQAAETNPTSAQGTPPAPTQTAPASAPAGDGPWANDLATLFPDAAQRAAVDDFVRSRVQPYTTQLEQRAAQAEDAVRLYTDLTTSPIETYVAITNELFGEQEGQAMLEFLQNQVNDQQQQQTQTPQQTVADPRIEAIIDWVEAKQTNEYYDSELARIKSEHPELVDKLFHPFVAAADGNFDNAYSLYEQWQKDYAEASGNLFPNGQQPPSPAAPVMGSDTNASQASNVPVEPRKQTLDEAIAEFAREAAEARQAPPIGSV